MTIGISEQEFDEEDDEDDLERLKIAEEMQRKRVRFEWAYRNGRIAVA
jgi:hypothetical protein